jgi:hypothetical protein
VKASVGIRSVQLPQLYEVMRLGTKEEEEEEVLSKHPSRAHKKKYATDAPPDGFSTDGLVLSISSQSCCYLIT